MENLMKKKIHFLSPLELIVNKDISHCLSSQGFSHLQSEYQKTVGGSQSPGAPNPVGQNPDWDSEYCNRECGGNHCRCVFVWVLVCVCVFKRDSSLFSDS